MLGATLESRFQDDPEEHMDCFYQLYIKQKCVHKYKVKLSIFIRKYKFHLYEAKMNLGNMMGCNGVSEDAGWRVCLTGVSCRGACSLCVRQGRGWRRLTWRLRAAPAGWRTAPIKG